MTGSPLHLVRARVDETALRVFATRRKVVDDDLGYALHLALRTRFGAAAPQPFRWPAPGDRPDMLLGYVSDPAPLLAAPAAAVPDWTEAWTNDDAALLNAILPDGFEARAMPSVWHAGQTFAFTTRFRPVTRYGREKRAERDSPHGKGAGERDAFLAAIERHEAAGDDVPPREDVYASWLAERLAPAVEASDVRITAHRRVRVVRSRHDAGSLARLEGPATEAEGLLRIIDPAGFASLLARGVGRHVAFGFGMLLLRPVGR
jgi:CRISPR system Cascade subunit CasE